MSEQKINYVPTDEALTQPINPTNAAALGSMATEVAAELAPDQNPHDDDILARMSKGAEMRVLSRGWNYDGSGQLQPTEDRIRDIGYEANELLRKPEPPEDPVLAEAIDRQTQELYEVERNRLQNTLNDFKAIKSTSPLLAEAIKGTQRQLDELNPHNFRLRPTITEKVEKSLLDTEKSKLEKVIADRIEADKFPWTMPDPKVSKAYLDVYKEYYDTLSDPATAPEARPGDKMKVRRPARNLDFTIDDLTLLDKAGEKDNGYYTRQQLQKAGIFFINRIGDGEQPIFGVPIPDASQPDGLFHVELRSVLTREEFEKVYQYQQEQGYGIGDKDPRDVQLDMVMALLTSFARGKYRIYSGPSGRESKYDTMRSPFVDSGFSVKYGLEGHLESGTEGLRLNTTVIHLINGHPDYPGVAEMFTTERDTLHPAYPDQRYMSPGDYIRELYVPLPTKEEVLACLQYSTPTKREKLWVSKPAGFED